MSYKNIRKFIELESTVELCTQYFFCWLKRQWMNGWKFVWNWWSLKNLKLIFLCGIVVRSDYNVVMMSMEITILYNISLQLSIFMLFPINTRSDFSYFLWSTRFEWKFIQSVDFIFCLPVRFFQNLYHTARYN